MDVRKIIAFLVTVCCIFGQVLASMCSMPGFTLSDDGDWCFAYTSNLESWPQKSMTCGAYGATLVTFENSTKHTQLQLYLNSLGGDAPSGNTKIWLGLVNSLNENIWINVQGDVATDLPWAENNPVSTDQYNCAYMQNGNPDYDIRNQNCLQNNVAICQMPSIHSGM